PGPQGRHQSQAEGVDDANEALTVSPVRPPLRAFPYQICPALIKAARPGAGPRRLTITADKGEGIGSRLSLPRPVLPSPIARRVASSVISHRMRKWNSVDRLWAVRSPLPYPSKSPGPLLCLVRLNDR